MFTKKFWKDLGERTLRTFAQGVAAFATGVSLDMVKADVKSVVVGGLIAGGFAVLTGLIAAFKNPEQQSASLLDQPVVTEPGRHDGSQDPYDASVEPYSNAPGVEPEVPVRAPLPPDPGPSQPMGFVATPPSFPSPVRPQRDPSTGRFLPRNQGDY